jgi:hypothetical protein
MGNLFRENKMEQWTKSEMIAEQKYQNKRGISSSWMSGE